MFLKLKKRDNVKYLVMIVVLTMFVSLFTGCGNDKAPEQNGADAEPGKQYQPLQI